MAATPPRNTNRPSYAPAPPHLSTPSLALPPHLTRSPSSASNNRRPGGTSASSSFPSRPASIASSGDLTLDASLIRDDADAGSGGLAEGSTAPSPASSESSRSRVITIAIGDASGEGESGQEASLVDKADAESSRMALRDKLRRTLGKGSSSVVRPVSSSSTASSVGKGKERAHDVSGGESIGGLSGSLESLPQGELEARKYFVLTDAGKPVFSNSDDSELNTIVGVIQTLISIFIEDDGDKLRSIKSGSTSIVFLLRAPLYYAAVSTWGEPESVLRIHLEYLHLQVLSIISGGQLKRIFLRRGNFDLRRLLEGTENFFNTLIDTLQNDFSFLSHSLEPLRISAATREAAGQALLLSSKSKGLVYALLLAGPSLQPVTLLRPKKHSIHPTDLHLLLNLIRSSPALRQVDNESFLPICLPKFSQEGFLYVYVTFPREDVGLVWVGTDKDGFESFREGKQKVLDKMEGSGLLQQIVNAVPQHVYSAGDLGIPGLQHFIYKSCTNVQLTQPRWDAPYEDVSEQRRLLTLYQKVHDALHGRSSPGAEPLSLLYVRTESESILGWFTQPFELYLSFSPSLPKAACVSVANKVARWVRGEEVRLFLKDAPVF